MDRGLLDAPSESNAFFPAGPRSPRLQRLMRSLWMLWLEVLGGGSFSWGDFAQRIECAEANFVSAGVIDKA